MAKCGACGKFISAADVVKCNKCCATYHRICTNRNASTSTTASSSWHCPGCMKTLAKDKESATPVGSESLSAGSSPEEFLDTTSISSHLVMRELKTELNQFKEEFFRTMRAELQLIREDMEKLRDTYNSRMANLEERLAALENNKEAHPAAPSGVEESIAQLKCKINERDQDLLGNDVEIANLPECPNENPMHTVMLVAAKIGLSIEMRDIVSAERIGGRRTVNAAEPAAELVRQQHRRLVVRLARRDLRDEMLRNARTRRGVNSADLDMPGPPTRFYVNERLTKLNRQLFRFARDAANQLGWKYVWTSRGRILTRNKPGDSYHVIRSEADLQRVFGPDT